MTHDNVNHPSHYTEGRQFEVVEVLEDWVGRAPDPVLGGLQWSCLKYQGRLWDKANALEDAKKSRWYLDRLIKKLEERTYVPDVTVYEEYRKYQEDFEEVREFDEQENYVPFDADERPRYSDFWMSENGNNVFVKSDEVEHLTWADHSFW